MRFKRLTSAALAATALAGVVAGANPADATGRDRPARLFEVTVEVTNLAPENGTFQTPVWVAVHDGSFDLYDRDQPISPELERLAEDGTIGPIADAFRDTGAGLDGIASGPGPIAPGATASVSFFVDARRGEEQFFSYASMVLPSNDAFVANGSPTAHRIINHRGRFVPTSFVVTGAEVLDAGSEVNDELPANTAFFGQQTPDTGVTENGNVVLHPGFNAPGTGGILDSDRFSAGDFTAEGYEAFRFDISARPIRNKASARLNGNNEVPAIDSRARGLVSLVLEDDGDIQWRINARRIDDVLFGHIHIGQPGENGPVAATIFNGDISTRRNVIRSTGEISAADLANDFEGLTTVELWEEIQAGNAYVNIHTEDFPAGELRANLP